MKSQRKLIHRSHLDSLKNITIQNLSHFKSNCNIDPMNKKQKNKKQEINVIRQTRKMIRGLSEKERFKKAKNHFYDALYYKRPKLETFSQIENVWVSNIQMFQESILWDAVLYVISYVFMYLVILDTDSNFNLKTSLEGVILIILWVDILLQNYHKTQQKISMTSKVQIRFYLKVLILIALVVDYVMFLCFYEAGARSVRPFTILRGFLPIFYDALTRKNFYAFASASKDIFVFLVFYAFIIIAFAIIGNQFIIVGPHEKLDNYKENYGELGKYIFVLYVMSSYDSYPDNQLAAIRNQPFIYIYFITFIFMNVLVFVTIPMSIIFQTFKQTRSKIILLDQIKQQHSLILAFVSLGENNFNINIEKLIRFLLYIYKNKIRYLNYITEIVLKMDENNNGSIQVNQFMQICKIMKQRESMMPPMMYDWKPWINFRNYMNSTLYIQAFFQNWWTKLGIVILIILTFFNGFIFIYTNIEALGIIDDVFAGIFVIQIILKIISFGFQDFFGARWNKLDFYIVMIGGILNCFPDNKIPHNMDVLVKMLRIYRISDLFKLLSTNTNLRLSNSIYRKFKQLLGQTAIMIPILMRFFPLFMIFYYFLGIIGMEAFYTIQKVPSSQSKYSMYSQFSNFKSFIGTQIIFVQVLTQAGWSMVAFDYSFRSHGYYGFVMIYFVACHIVIVQLMTSLFKGIVWQVYFAVDEQYKQKLVQQMMIQNQEEDMIKKKQQYQDIHTKIQTKQLILPTTVVKRQIFQNKIDDQIFKKLKLIYLKAKQTQQFNYLKSKERMMLVPHLMNDRGVDLKDIRYVQNSSSENTLQDLYEKIKENNLKNFSNLQYVEEEDFQQKMQNLLSKLILNPKIHFSQAIVYPKHFVQYLTKNLKRVNSNLPLIGFNINSDILSNNNSQSLKFHSYSINVLLEIQKSAREQKLQIAQHMINEGIITQEGVKEQFAKKLKKQNYSIEVNHILRKVFLQGTNEDLIKKFEVQYFSNVYGQSFRQINKVTIEPLLKYEATLTYNLRNILRYSGIKTNQFFKMLVNIQNSCSNKLLKKGSLFKFVYQLDSLSDTWFTIQYSHQRQTLVHFIKTGIWLYNKNQIEKQIYYGKDIFNWDLTNISDKKSCEKYMKLLFQNFQTLGLSEINQKAFFNTNPEYTIYDLFFFFVNTSLDVPASLKKLKLKISKIMLVVLSKEEEREEEEKLPYSVSDIIEEEQNNQPYDFKLNESQNQTFQKLKKMQVLDREKIVESEGLPYAYIINLMTQIKEVLQIYKQTLIHHAQIVLNEQFDQVFDEDEKINSSKRSKVIRAKSEGTVKEENRQF